MGVAVKQSLEKLDGPDDLAERVRDSRFTSLPITAGHGVRASGLPALHRDPFDRILVAQGAERRHDHRHPRQVEPAVRRPGHGRLIRAAPDETR
ncbi:protein of unknown function [Streptomyces sp. KY75]|nr:protein of unknown function [Streptomyces sp. KY70]CAD5983800.1 protein of unknown function [Streptomyces sp. KY75]